MYRYGAFVASGVTAPVSARQASRLFAQWVLRQLQQYRRSSGGAEPALPIPIMAAGVYLLFFFFFARCGVDR